MIEVVPVTEPGPTDPAAEPEREVLRDDRAWDRFVESSPTGAYPQLSAWAEVKRANGWQASRLVVSDPADAAAPPQSGIGLPAGAAVGAQVLLHRLGPTPWGVGYAPRGPLAAPSLSAGALGAFSERIRELARRERLSHVTIDPEVELGHPLGEGLIEAGWRQAPSIQPDRTRLVDLARPEADLWADLRGKWRQYVQKARRNGVTVVEGGREGLDDFYRIYAETARRAGFIHRAASAYARTYDAFAAGGRARLLFAVLEGEPVAALFLLQCGRRIIEPYGGMLAAGAASRANYLLKWEAIRSSRERGLLVYDMWGLSHPGIEQFKSGFGGREVRYVGAFELVANRPLHAAVGAAQRARVALARRRHGLAGGGAEGADAG